MLKFKRLANLTTDADVIVTALEESKLIEVRTCTVPYSSLMNWYFRHFQNQEESYLTDVYAIYLHLICNKKVDNSVMFWRRCLTFRNLASYI